MDYWRCGCLACLAFIFSQNFGPGILRQLRVSWEPLPQSKFSDSRSHGELLVVVEDDVSFLKDRRYARASGLQSFFEDGFFVLNFRKVFAESGRRLHNDSGNTSQSNSCASQGSAHGAHESHPHDALFFMFNALIFGTAILHLTMLPSFHALQQSVTLFVLGMLYSLIQEGFKVKEDIGVFGVSYDMWMGIEPHLLLFSMLPALLAGDAMTIDTGVARSVGKQCMFLAGPGVLFGSFMTALFLWVYIPDWEFLLCLVTGSILGATDPVAVVGLLKELGASPTLTVQIQGESLLNDGTAIVLYGVAYDLLKGKDYDSADIVIILVVVAVCAAGLGVVIGWIFYLWIRLAHDRLNHSAGLLQTALTILCAYWSFCMAEGFLKISGVLCTVFASLVLADKMWPVIVDKQSLLHIWHMIEYLGNTIIFFLAGALFGKEMVHVDLIDYLHLLVIYAACTLIRAVLIFGCRPILGLLGNSGEKVTVADAFVMTWGGLRGAVGLALAIAVRIDKAEDAIDDKQARRVLFFVGGVASLTLCINATTCPALVRWLGITKTPSGKQKMLYKVHSQLESIIAADAPGEAVQEAIGEVLQDVKHHIDHLAPQQKMDRVDTKDIETILATMEVQRSQSKFPCADQVCERLDEARQKFEDIVERNHVPILELLDVPLLPFREKELEMETMIRENDCSAELVKCVHEAFLSLVREQYWKQLDEGDFVGGSNSMELMLTSTSLAMTHAGTNLCDLKYLLQRLKVQHEDDDGSHALTQLLEAEEGQEFQVRGSLQSRDHACVRPGNRTVVFTNAMSPISHSRLKSAFRDIETSLRAQRSKRLHQDTCLLRFIHSLQFDIFMSAVIVLNGIFILIEQTQRKGSNYNDAIWITAEITFTSIFLVEFIVKVLGQKCGYFCDAWNLFDFTILCLSLFGLIVELLVEAASEDETETGSKEARIFRLNRVFRILRIFRTFRLFKLYNNLMAKVFHQEYSEQLAERLRIITASRAFVHAHINSQAHLVEYFGDHGAVSTPEEARCILESQAQIYNILVLALQEALDIEEATLVGLRLLRDNLRVTEKLSKFVHSAYDAGVISAREASTVSHPLQDHVRIFNLQMRRTVKNGRLSGDVNLRERRPSNCSGTLRQNYSYEGERRSSIVTQEDGTTITLSTRPSLRRSATPEVDDAVAALNTRTSFQSRHTPPFRRSVGEDEQVSNGENVAARNKPQLRKSGDGFQTVTIGSRKPDSQQESPRSEKSDVNAQNENGISSSDREKPLPGQNFP